MGEAAWKSCRQLQAVHLPETVVSLLHGALSRCQVPRVVTVPDCKHFGTQVFEECCSQTQTGTAQCPGNVLAPQAQLRPRAFQGCTALRHLNLGMSGCGPAYPNRCLPDCCFVKKSVGSTPVQCVDHLVPLCSGTFSFSVVGVGAEWGSSFPECVCFDHLSRTEWNVTRSGWENV